MIKSFIMFMLGAMSMYGFLVLWAAWNGLINQTRRNPTITQNGGAGNDEFTNITINTK